MVRMEKPPGLPWQQCTRTLPQLREDHGCVCMVCPDGFGAFRLSRWVSPMPISDFTWFESWLFVCTRQTVPRQVRWCAHGRGSKVSTSGSIIAWPRINDFVRCCRDRYTPRSFVNFLNNKTFALSASRLLPLLSLLY